MKTIEQITATAMKAYYTQKKVNKRYRLTDKGKSAQKRANDTYRLKLTKEEKAEQNKKYYQNKKIKDALLNAPKKIETADTDILENVSK